MSDSKGAKGPKAVIEQVDEDARAAGRTPDSAKAARPSQPSDAESLHDATLGLVRGLGRRAWRYADAHPHTVLYGAIGLLLAVLILVIGLWNTIVVAVFTGAGAAIGSLRDGDDGVGSFFNRVFGAKR